MVIEYFNCIDKSDICTKIVSTTAEYNNFFKENCNHGLNILHTNIRSIDKNLDELKVLLSGLHKQFQIIACTETHIVENLELYNIYGYTTYYNNSHFNKNDGVMVFVDNNLSHNVNVHSINNLNLIRIECNYNDIDIAVTVIYKSPPVDDNIFIANLHTYISTKCVTKNEIITGDINIDILSNDQDNIIAHDYLNLMQEYGFKSYINHYTRVTEKSKSCIDHFFVRTTLNNDILPVISKSKITDHYPIALHIQTDKNYSYSSPNIIETKFFNYKKLSELGASINWNSLINADIDSSLYNLCNEINILVNQCTTVKTYSSKTRSRTPWITKGIIKSINIRDVLYKQLKLDPGNVAIFEVYEKYRKFIPKLIKHAKNKYYVDKVETCHDPKHIWELADNCINKNKHLVKNFKLNHNNKTISDPQKISELFNDHFINIGEHLSSKIQKKVNPFLNKIPLNNKTIFLNPISEDEILSIVNSLNNSNSCGYDKISIKTIKSLSVSIIPSLCNLFNQCLIKGHFPEIFKKSIVTPVYKNGNKEELNNYRPISIISNLGKILEKIISQRLQSFINANNLLSPQQFGFRSGKSTNDAIIDLTQCIYNTLDKSRPSLAVFLDLAKAFDTVNHKLLLKKLDRYGIRGTPLLLIKSYLENRKQTTKILGIVSSEKTVTCGVPQGTVLGPLLFILYLNDLLNLNLHCKFFSYADDTALYYEAESWSTIEKLATNDLIIIKNWLDCNRLSLNSDKSHFLTFTLYKNSQPCLDSLLIHETDCLSETCTCPSILRKCKTTYLGIVFDEHIRWNLHIDAICKKIRKTLYIFKQIRNIFPIKYLRMFYFGLVQSIIRYGILCWGGAVDRYKKKLKILQKKILKILSFKPLMYSSETIFKDINVFTVEQLFIADITKYIIKHPSYIQIPNHKYGTRCVHNKVALPTKYTKCKLDTFFNAYIDKIYNHFNLYVSNNKIDLTLNNHKKVIKSWITVLDTLTIQLMLKK